MTETAKRLAILIDGDNIDSSLLDGLWRSAAKLGTVTERRVYCDQKHRAHWKKAVATHGLTLVPSVACGKNATDIALAIGAMDLVYAGSCDAVGIVSSDRDFIPLAERLRADGMKAYLFAGQKPRKIASSTYVRIEKLAAAEEALSEAQKRLIAIIRQLSPDNAYVENCKIGQLLERKYRVSKLKKLIEATHGVELSQDGTSTRLRKAS